MREFAVLVDHEKVGKGKRAETVPVFETIEADGLKIVDGCLVLFVSVPRNQSKLHHMEPTHREVTVKAYGVGGWLQVEPQEVDD